jgi:hypothetical protein
LLTSRDKAVICVWNIDKKLELLSDLFTQRFFVPVLAGML